MIVKAAIIVLCFFLIIYIIDCYIKQGSPCIDEDLCSDDEFEKMLEEQHKYTIDPSFDLLEKRERACNWLREQRKIEQKLIFVPSPATGLSSFNIDIPYSTPKLLNFKYLQGPLPPLNRIKPFRIYPTKG